MADPLEDTFAYVARWAEYTSIVYCQEGLDMGVRPAWCSGQLNAVPVSQCSAVQAQGLADWKGSASVCRQQTA